MRVSVSAAMMMIMAVAMIIAAGVAMMMMVVVAVLVPVIASAADAADVIVMADLRRAPVGLVAEHLLAVLAEQAVHQVGAVHRLVQPLDKGVDHQRMVVQIVGLDDLDLRMRLPAGVRGGRKCDRPGCR